MNKFISIIIFSVFLFNCRTEEINVCQKQEESNNEVTQTIDLAEGEEFISASWRTGSTVAGYVSSDLWVLTRSRNNTNITQIIYKYTNLETHETIVIHQY